MFECFEYAHIAGLIFNNTGWVKDGDNRNYPLISGIGWRIRLIFHVLNKQRLRFDLVYRTLGYIFMYLGKSGISLRQASKKAKLARNSLMNSNKNVISYHWYSTFYMTLKWHFMTFCMQKWWKLIQNVMLNVIFLRLLIRLFLSNFAFFEACATTCYHKDQRCPVRSGHCGVKVWKVPCQCRRLASGRTEQPTQHSTWNSWICKVPSTWPTFLAW